MCPTLRFCGLLKLVTSASPPLPSPAWRRRVDRRRKERRQIPSSSSPFLGWFHECSWAGRILAQREFERRFSPRFLGWAAVGVMALPSTGLLLLRGLSKRKYDIPKTKTK